MSDRRELSRAEAARQRRAKRAASELTQTRKRATTPIVQPVTRRATPMPVQKTTFVQAQKKRRFQVALGLPDVHLRQPISVGQKQNGGRWRIASFGVAILLGFAIFFALFLPYFNVPSVTVLGNERLSREEISIASGTLGQSIFTVNPSDVETRLRIAYPELLSVRVEVYLPNHVYVTTEERVPVILWQQNNAYTWIDANGVAFRPHEELPGLVPVTALANPPQGISDDPLVPAAYMQKDLADAILQLAPSVPADTRMIYDGTYGLGWQDAYGWRVYFGTASHNMALKVRVYQSLAQSLLSRNVAPVFINVAYPEAPYYRMAAEVPEVPAPAPAADSGQ